MRFLYIILLLIFGVSAGETCHTDKKLVVACTIECRDTYKQAIQEAAVQLGYKVDVITLIEQPNADYDALLSPGGGDIHYRYYTDKKYNPLLPDVSEFKDQIVSNYKKYSGERDEKGLKRDAFEIALWRDYFSKKKFQLMPALGICYGMQMLGVSSGLPMYVDIENSLGVPARRKILEKVDIFGEAKAITKIERPFTGYYNHHQALRYDFYKSHIKNYSERFEVIASSHKDKIPEMLRFKKRAAFGTQFHPERLTKDHRKNAIEIFKWFLGQACVFATQK